MLFPNKVISFNESILPKLPLVLHYLEHGPKKISDRERKKCPIPLLFELSIAITYKTETSDPVVVTQFLMLIPRCILTRLCGPLPGLIRVRLALRQQHSAT